jgi:hypothetical protein
MLLSEENPILRDYAINKSGDPAAFPVQLVDFPAAPHVHDEAPVGHNADMRTQADIRDAVNHLPEAAVLVLDDISWEEYEEITQDFEERSSIRITYDQGRLEIVTTSRLHEFWKVTVLLLVYEACQELDFHMEGYGGATWERKDELRAVDRLRRAPSPS